MIADLHSGLWRPYFQIYDGGSMGLTAKTFPGTISVGRDTLKNETKSIVILRALSITYNWNDTRRYAFSLTFHTGTKIYKHAPHSIPNCPPTNIATGLYGSTATAAMPYVFKLARPCRVGIDETVLCEFGNVEDEITYYFAATTGDKPSSLMIFAKGVNTGRVIPLGMQKTITSGDVSRCTFTWRNQTDEPVDIESVTICTGDATTDRPIFKMEVAGRPWSRAEVPLWLYGDPFKYSRCDFSRLPEGGVVMEPGAHLELTIQGYVNADAASFMTLGMETYQQVDS